MKKMITKSKCVVSKIIYLIPLFSFLAAMFIFTHGEIAVAGTKGS